MTNCYGKEPWLIHVENIKHIKNKQDCGQGWFNLLVNAQCSVLNACTFGTTLLDRSTFDRIPFDPGWLWVVSDPRSIRYHWFDIRLISIESRRMERDWIERRKILRRSTVHSSFQAWYYCVGTRHVLIFVSQAKLVTSVKKGKPICHSAHRITSCEQNLHPF